MNKLILVRYGESESGSLTQKGRETMQATGERIVSMVDLNEVVVATANVSRAIESTEILTQILNVSPATILDELYAAEEENKLPNPELAMAALECLDYLKDTVIAVVSREYIETLPSSISKMSFFKEEENEKRLSRGEALLIDFEKGTFLKI